MTTLDPTLPIIEFRSVRNGDGAALAEAARAIDRAFCETGFCYLRHHGIPEPVIAEAAREALDFFRLPLAVKQASAPKESVRGFNARGRTTLYGAKYPDYKEYFQIGLELPRDDPAVLAGQALRGPNQWPEGRPAFRQAMQLYFDAVAACGHDLLRAVALSLGISADFFRDKYAKPLQRTQCVYYPPHPSDAPADLFGVAPHTDYGCITLLWQDQVGGLEVLSRQGDWVPAVPLEGTLVVNIGDLLARWSNDRYRSTPHRVTNRSGRERLSIATFFDPDYSATVDPKALGLPPDTPPLYPAIAAGDYIIGRISASLQAAAAG